MPTILEHLQKARESLLDLTLRNRLLNFLPSKRFSIGVVDEIPREIFDILVLKEKPMVFRPVPAKDKMLPADSENQDPLKSDTDMSEEEAKVLWKAPIPEKDVGDRHLDKYLQTSLEAENLQKKLFFVNQQARSAVEEQGVTILYLALGFLEWKEAGQAEQFCRAPLILIPVELERASVSVSYHLKWTGEDIFTNISLKAKLVDQGIDFPDFEMPEEKEGIDAYFSAVADAVASCTGWNVTANIYLSFFSFTKFVMYKDLDVSSWSAEKSPLEHPLIKALFATETVAADTRPVFCEDEIDVKLRAHDLYHVMDADPSQIAAIEELKIGRNLVVEGPPGTGKSQTIANAIAELIASGKTVLFVSEKMAALEVVKDRLDKVGLGTFCLELHSRKSNKKEVLEEIERSLKRTFPRAGKFQDELDELEKIKTELNNFARILREPYGKIGLSAFSLYCLRERANKLFDGSNRVAPRFSIDQLNNLSREAFIELKGLLRELATVAPVVSPIHEHPWRFSKAKVILPADEEDIQLLLAEVMAALEKLKHEAQLQITLLRSAVRPSLGMMAKLVDAGNFMSNVMALDKAAINEAWESSPETWLRPLNKIEEFQQLYSSIKKSFVADVLDADLEKSRSQLQVYSKKILRFLDKNYHILNKDIARLYATKAPRSLQQRLTDLASLERCQSIRREIRALESSGLSLFGSYWKAELSEVDKLKQAVDATNTFRKLFKASIFTEETLAVHNRAEVAAQTKQMNAAHSLFLEKIKSFCSKTIANDQVLLADNRLLDELLAQLSDLRKEIPKLAKWARYYSVREKCCLQPVLQAVVNLLESGAISATEMIADLEVNVADSFLREAFSEFPALAAFIGDLHEKKIVRFQELDQEMIKMNQTRLQAKLFQNRPPVISGASPSSEAGIILGEFSKKRRHMPIRKLLFHAGRLIQRIKPCFMMSPLSIAQFLDPRSINFDVVVFDEASQVKPADALGALLRGQQAAVMGDTKQLPPTSFFDHMATADDADFESADSNVTDVESILHLCKRSFPTKILKWHYRSKHESLIAVSNQEFYDNELLIYPSPCHDLPDLGLKFNLVPDSIYDRGRSSVNRKEAQAVVAAAMEHYRKWPNKSLGIGAFNIKQQQAILEEVELQLKLNPEMEEFFSSKHNEHFFVKNLETIQGDERDVIFLSIGFGFDETHQISRNFGPLNQDGGQRRLNVLISRARERCVVFSNFKANDLQLDAGAPFGLRSLKRFLDYAENRTLFTSDAGGEDTDSPFEDAVYSFLKNNGYEVRKQVGCARFRIDLAVVDPRNPGKYLVAVECDGAKYHSSPVARDRDRLREQILKKLGWQIHRIWSTDWYRNRRDTENRLLQAIKRLKESTAPQEHTEAEKPEENNSPSSADGDGPAGQSSFEKDLPESVGVPPYQACQSLPFKNRGDLHLQPIDQLALNVIHIVKEEGPIHVHELIRRMRTLWGLGRTGDRIVDVGKQAIRAAVKQGRVEMRGKFLWAPNRLKVKVRKRTDDPKPDIELICEEEIQEAVRLVLIAQFSTAMEDLAVAASRLFGFQATRDDTSRRVQHVIEGMIKTGELELMPSGAIHFSVSPPVDSRLPVEPIGQLRPMDPSGENSFTLPQFQSPASRSVRESVDNAKTYQRDTREKGIIVKVDDVLIKARSVSDMYSQVLKLLISSDLIKRIPLPYATSAKRYLLSNKPEHPAGNSFVIPIQQGVYYMEAHKDYKNAVSHLKNMLDECGILFECITTYND